MIKALLILAAAVVLAGCDPQPPKPPPAPLAKPFASLPPEPTVPPAPAPPPDPTLEGAEPPALPEPAEAAETPAPAAGETKSSSTNFERNMIWLRAIKKGSPSERERAISAIKKLPSDELEEFEGLRKFYHIEY